MAKATKTSTSTTKPTSAGAASTKGKKTETVARPAIGKDDKDLKEEKKQAASTTTSASKKRKSPSSSTTDSTSTPAAKDPEHDIETLKNTEKNSKSKTKGIPTTSATTRSEDNQATTSASSSNKRTKVSVNQPAVTLEKTVEELELPKITKSPKSAGSKKTPASTTSDSVSNEVAPSSTKPAKGLKSALKTTTPTSSSKKPTTTSSSKDVEMKDAEFIHGFSSSSENGGDSSDEDDSDVDMDASADAGEKSTIKAKDLPKVVEGDKEVQEKLSKAKKRSVSCPLRLSS
jgi:nucleolin